MIRNTIISGLMSYFNSRELAAISLSAAPARARDGEPTLEIKLDKEVDAVKGLGVKAAVIGNASLLWMEDVRRDLMNADWVSVKVDVAFEDAWRGVNRPHGTVLEGIREFSKEYGGTLSTETKLVKGSNDGLIKHDLEELF